MSKHKRTGPDWQTVGLGTLAGIVAGMGLIVVATETTPPPPIPVTVEIIDGASIERPDPNYSNDDDRFTLGRTFTVPEGS